MHLLQETAIKCAVVDYAIDGRTRGTCVENLFFFVSTNLAPKKVNVSSELCLAPSPATSTIILGG